MDEHQNAEQWDVFWLKTVLLKKKGVFSLEGF